MAAGRTFWVLLIIFFLQILSVATASANLHDQRSSGTKPMARIGRATYRFLFPRVGLLRSRSGRSSMSPSTSCVFVVVPRWVPSIGAALVERTIAGGQSTEVGANGWHMRTRKGREVILVAKVMSDSEATTSRRKRSVDEDVRISREDSKGKRKRKGLRWRGGKCDTGQQSTRRDERIDVVLG